jgi:DUF4097 and DUF4098 domain-containing protein YvlB
MRLRVASGSQRVEVVASATAGFAVHGQAQVHHEDGQITLDRVRGAVTVHVPEGSDVVIGTASGRIRCAGRLGAVAVTTKSGRIDVEHAASLDVRAASSTVTVGAVDGTCRIRTASGRVSVGASGEAEVSTRSGRITLRHVSGRVNAHSISGRVSVQMVEANDVHAETVTGRIELTMPRGSDVEQVAPGAPLRPPGSGGTVVARSTTGRVVVAYR